jgi:hypothetical protein
MTADDNAIEYWNIVLLQIKRRNHFPGGNIGFLHLINKKNKKIKK